MQYAFVKCRTGYISGNRKSRRPNKQDGQCTASRVLLKDVCIPE